MQKAEEPACEKIVSQLRRHKVDAKITKGGRHDEKVFYVDKRDGFTCKVRWEQLDEDLTCTPNELAKVSTISR
jgi:hypothetical protein